MTHPKTQTRTVAAGTVRSADQPRTITGYAVRFNEQSDNLGGFVEVVDPRAFDGIDMSELLLVYAHDYSNPLGRVSAGNLQVRVDGEGVWFNANLPDTTVARDVYTLIKDGVIRGMSFGFTVANDEWTKTSQGKHLRRILQVADLFELTITAVPAYPTTSVTAATRTAYKRLEAHTQTRTGKDPLLNRINVKQRPAYGVGSTNSYFRDLAQVLIADTRKSTSINSLLDAGGVPRAIGSNPLFESDNRHGTLDEARQRLATIQTRAIDTGASAFTGIGAAPSFVGDLWAQALRARAPLATALETSGRQLPQGEMAVKAPRVTTGATTTVQATQNTSVNIANLVLTTASGPIATTAGYIDASAQVVELSGLDGSLFDEAVTRELAAAYAAALETQIVQGTGASGQLAGLLATSGVTTVTYTDASPSPAKNWSQAVQQAVSTAHTAAGAPPDLIALHPRRGRYIASGDRTAPAWPVATVAETLGMPTNQGAGTNEDRIVIARSEYVHLLTRLPTLTVHEDSAADTLTVRYRVYGMAGLIVTQPAAVTIVSGTGLTAPVFP